MAQERVRAGVARFPGKRARARDHSKRRWRRPALYGLRGPSARAAPDPARVHDGAAARSPAKRLAPRRTRPGTPFNDPSGDRLRDWLGMDRDTFYDGSRVAILPMGLCYPGRLPQGGDVGPRERCAPLWHPRLLPLMPGIRPHFAGRGLRAGLRARTGGDGRARPRLRPVSPTLLPATAPVLAHHGLGEAQRMVRRHGAARASPDSRGDARLIGSCSGKRNAAWAIR